MTDDRSHIAVDSDSEGRRRRRFLRLFLDVIANYPRIARVKKSTPPGSMLSLPAYSDRRRE